MFIGIEYSLISVVSNNSGFISDAFVILASNIRLIFGNTLFMWTL